MTFDAKRLTELRRVSDLAFAPDESWLAVSVGRLKQDESGYVSDLWRVELSGDGEPRQLTRGEQSDSAPRFRRDGSLAFVSKRPPLSGEQDGEPTAQVWLLPASGGDAIQLTDEPHGVLEFRFARDADTLVVLAMELPGIDSTDQRKERERREKRGASGLLYKKNHVRNWDHWIPEEAPRFFAFDASGDQLAANRRALTADFVDELRGDIFGLGWDLSADGRSIATAKHQLASDRLIDASIVLIDTSSGARTDLASENLVWFHSPRFSPDGTSVVALREPRPVGEYVRPQVVLCAPASEPKTLPIEHDITQPEFSTDGRALLFSADLDGQKPVFRYELATGELIRVSSQASGGCHDNLVISGEHIASIHHCLLAPPEPFALPSNGSNATPRQLASLSGIEAGELDFATTSYEESTAADGTRVPWFCVQPIDSGAPRPGLLLIHGGPVGQWADGWHWRWNAAVWVAAGHVAALPNPRGSTGLGKASTDGIWNNTWGAECFTDLMTVTDDLAAREFVDETRLAALGGSFGGYMANWIGTQTDRFRCLVSHAGLYHFPAFYGTTDYPPYWRYEMACDPYSDPEGFSKYSPHQFIDNWKSPVLVIHGEKDYRVPVSEALLLFDALRDRDIDCELLVFPNENHWILRPHNARRWYGEVMRFLSAHLE